MNKDEQTKEKGKIRTAKYRTAKFPIGGAKGFSLLAVQFCANDIQG